MNSKQPTGGRELNEISAPAGQHYTPVFFPLLKLTPGELAEARQSSWQPQPVRLFQQTSKLLDS
jgi:hypothetical protein